MIMINSMIDEAIKGNFKDWRYVIKGISIAFNVYRNHAILITKYVVNHGIKIILNPCRTAKKNDTGMNIAKIKFKIKVRPGFPNAE